VSHVQGTSRLSLGFDNNLRLTDSSPLLLVIQDPIAGVYKKVRPPVPLS
jgi:hypothetical protein